MSIASASSGPVSKFLIVGYPSVMLVMIKLPADLRNVLALLIM
jgi:hypothetical protein